MKSIEYSKNGDVVFYIDTDKRTIVAVLKCQKDEPNTIYESQLDKLCASSSIQLQPSLDFYGVKHVLINDRFVGKAKCHPNDEFDIEYGKALALLRAKEKHQKALEAKLLMIDNTIKDFAKRMHRRYEKQYRALLDIRSQVYAKECEKREC